MKLLFIDFAKSFNNATSKLAFMNAKKAFISNDYKNFIVYFKDNSREFVLDEITNHCFLSAFNDYLQGKINDAYYKFYTRGKKVCETKDFLFHIKNISLDENTMRDFTEHMEFFKSMYLDGELFEMHNNIDIFKYKDENIILDGEHRAVLAELSPELKLNYKIYEEL